MFFVVYKAVPTERAAERDATGAFVSCWIDFKSQDGAIALAQYAISNHGWTPLHLDSIAVVDSSNYSEGQVGAAQYREAIEDGWSFTFHVWEQGQNSRE